MPAKEWYPFAEHCPRCGARTSVLSLAGKDGGEAQDGDRVECVGCGHHGFCNANISATDWTAQAQEQAQ